MHILPSNPWLPAPLIPVSAKGLGRLGTSGKFTSLTLDFSLPAHSRSSQKNLTQRALEAWISTSECLVLLLSFHMPVVSPDYGKVILFHLQQKVGYKREAENLNQLIKDSKKDLKIRNKNKQTNKTLCANRGWTHEMKRGLGLLAVLNRSCIVRELIQTKRILLVENSWDEKWEQMDKKGLSDSGSACEELRNCHSILISPRLKRLKNQELFLDLEGREYIGQTTAPNIGETGKYRKSRLLWVR